MREGEGVHSNPRKCGRGKNHFPTSVIDRLKDTEREYIGTGELCRFALIVICGSGVLDGTTMIFLSEQVS